jgi:hypothetical protein
MKTMNFISYRRTHVAHQIGITLVVVLTGLHVCKSWAEDAHQTSSFNGNWLRAFVSVEQMESLTNAHSIGTGFLLVSPKGHLVLVTAKHVVANEDGSVRQNLAFRLNEKTNRSD